MRVPPLQPRSRFAVLPVLLLGGCIQTVPLPVDDDDSTSESTAQIDGPSGALLELDPSTLPDGVSIEEVSLELLEEDPGGVPSSVELGYSATLRLLPEGIELSAPARVVLPVMSWEGWGTSARDPFANDGQITDPLTQANVQVLGEAPALAMANLYQSSAQALGLAAHNATTAQQSANAMLQATTAQGVAGLYGVDTAATAGAATIVSKIQPGWDAFASDPAGVQLLRDLGILPVNNEQSTGQAAAGSAARDGEHEYNTFRWVESAPGVWDAELDTRFFETFSLVKLRVDADGNGIHDVMEGPEDTDGDGIWNPLDWDNDGDRIADEFEAGFDEDEDGLLAMNDPDRDGDGVLDGLPECDAGATCACGLRQDGVRVLCGEGSELLCQDGDLGFGDVLYEVIPNLCPPPKGLGAVCTDGGGVDVTVYTGPETQVAAAFCGECQPGTVSPAGFCPSEL